MARNLENGHDKRVLPNFRQVFLFTALFLSPSLTYATFVTNFGPGTFNAGNSSVEVTGGSGTGCIQFFSSGSAPACVPGSTSGGSSFTVNPPDNGPFAPGESGFIDSIDFTNAFPIVNFMVVTTPSGVVHFDLKDLRTNTGANIGSCSGAGGLAPGASCTPSGSPFTITNGLIDPSTGVVDTVTISLTVDLFGYVGTSGTNYNAANPYVGIFTTQSALSGNIETILATISGGGSETASWSASFAPLSPVPEPATFGTLGLSLIGVGYVLRRRFGK
jgi:hypothetical protein